MNSYPFSRPMSPGGSGLNRDGLPIAERTITASGRRFATGSRGWRGSGAVRFALMISTSM